MISIIMPFLQKYWMHIALIVLAAALAALVMGWRSDSQQLPICKQSLRMMHQQAEQQMKQAAIEREQADEYFKELDNVSRELNRLKRVQPARCIPVQSTRSYTTPASADGKLPATHGVTSDALYDFAADAERVRQQLLACQTWAKSLN